jgi:hypothetical protein
MALHKPYLDIPGTTIFDAEQSRKGYHLNLGATYGKSFQQMAGSMTGMTEEEYRDMMIAGGRSVEGNRCLGEDGSAQPYRQPQGSSKTAGF